ncbi:protein FAM50A-like isoform X2 [Dysidea avara]|uniref:protein FAM50A-like isoform X2 n=1 Tax=Dysidea avara TaxID=196820 RepID=UPI0033213AA2
MAHYKGAASEGNRAATLLKKREQAKEEFEFMKKRISEGHAARFENITSKFSSTYDAVEEQLKSSTIGLVTLNEMKAKQEDLVREREKQLAANQIEAEKRAERKSRLKRKKDKLEARVLSFGDEEDEHEEEEVIIQIKKKKVGKNPTVDTSFLPDRDREEKERHEREKLANEWKAQQEKIKNEDIAITYSYWDGSGHRRMTTMKKGDTIYKFLQKCLETLRKDFNELRVASVDNLMYIKEDLIIPQHHSFYDFIVTKARGKSGPLFSFDVHDDVRLMNDAHIEKDESHAGKVVLRSWYERNKHIFPASRWEPYDPEKSYDKYTVSDKSDE